MKRTFVLLAVAILFVVLHPSSTGADVVTATIVGVDVRNDGTFLIEISQATTGAPACASVTNQLSASANTAGGKALLQLAISVYLSGRSVSVYGTGACSEFSNIESLVRIFAH